MNAAARRAARQLAAAVLEALMAESIGGPRAYFARGFTGAALGKEPASTLLVSVPFAGTETALELLVDLGGVVDDLIFMHTDRQGRFSPRREDRQAIAEVAEMLEAQARRLRGVVAEVPGHG
jgi:hypothetical protein